MAIKIKNSTIIDDSRNLVDVGISTVTSLSIGSNEVISSSRQLKNIASLDAVTTATIESAIVNAPNTFTDLNVTGISTLNVVEASSLNVTGIVTASGFNGGPLSGSSGSFTQVNVSGIGTIATLDTTNGTIDYLGSTNINASGIVTATRFVSTATTGTAPFAVSSTTVVPNLNADSVDGLQASQFLRSDANDSASGVITFENGNTTYGTATAISAEFGVNTSSAGAIKFHGITPSSFGLIQQTTENLHIDCVGGGLYLNYYDGNFVIFGSGSGSTVAVMGPDGDLWKGSSDNTGDKYWHAGNDGPGSGLDADTVDGLNPSSSNTASTIVSRDASGNFSAGTITATSYNVGTDVGISTTRTTVATTSPTTIDSFAVATYRSARVQVQITQSTNYQTSDVLVIHDGSTASVVEYGSIATNDYLGTFSATVSGGNCLLQINMGSATSATVKVLSQRITV